jgi:hypothetical protein
MATRTILLEILTDGEIAPELFLATKDSEKSYNWNDQKHRRIQEKQKENRLGARLAPNRISRRKPDYEKQWDAEGHTQR